MEWTRGPLVRALALAASFVLVVTHWTERDYWFWIGLALIVLNVFGLWSARRASAGGGDPETARPQGADIEEPVDLALADLLHRPGVAAAFAAGPQSWRQVSYLDDEPLDPLSVPEVAAYVWISNDDGWEIGLDDEMKPHLDLDVPEEQDPIIGVLKSHPGVTHAYHEDREVYRIEQSRPISVEEFAELAVRALVAHHVQVAARLG